MADEHSNPKRETQMSALEELVDVPGVSLWTIRRGGEFHKIEDAEHGWTQPGQN